LAASSKVLRALLDAALPHFDKRIRGIQDFRQQRAVQTVEGQEMA